MSMKDCDLKILNQKVGERNVKRKTFHGYKTAMKHYVEFYGISFDEMVKEAQQDQNDKIDWYSRKIVKRLVNYRKYLYEKYIGKTAKLKLTNVIRLYKACGIEMNELPYFNKKNAKRNDPITWEDLATLDELKEMINISDPIVPALFLFMLSSALAKIDTLNISIIEFIKGTEPWHGIETYTHHDKDKTDDENEKFKIKQEKRIIREVLSCLLEEKRNIIPIFRLQRQKTKKYFTAHCSPEAIKAIVAYLVSRTDELTYEKKLFKINERYFDDKFKEANDKLARFKKREKKRFTSHMLRKMNASLLYKGNYLNTSQEYKIALDKEQIEALQGRSKGDNTEVAYYKDNPEILRQLYIRALPLITVSYEYTKKELDNIIDVEAEKKADEKTELIQKQLEENKENEKAMLADIASLKKTQERFLSKFD